MKREKGITLISIVIIIIILLIFGEIMFSSFFGADGIIKYVELAKKQMEEKKLEEEFILQGYTRYIDENTGQKYITYEEFGAKGSSDNDDYNSIKKAHEVANKYGLSVRATRKRIPYI